MARKSWRHLGVRVSYTTFHLLKALADSRNLTVSQVVRNEIEQLTIRGRKEIDRRRAARAAA